MLYPVTDEIRKAMTVALYCEREHFKTLKHISGDECSHCDSRSLIKMLEESLETGFYEENREDY